MIKHPTLFYFQAEKSPIERQKSQPFSLIMFMSSSLSSSSNSEESVGKPELDSVSAALSLVARDVVRASEDPCAALAAAAAMAS